MKKGYDVGQLRGAFGAGYVKGQMDQDAASSVPSVPPNPTGKWFHSSDESGNIKWQGQVLKRVDRDVYRCQLYEWVMGSPSDIITVHATEMASWRFYSTSDEMNQAYHARSQNTNDGRVR